MAAIDLVQLRQDIRTRLFLIGNALMPAASNFAYQNREFEPPKEQAWIRETMLPGAERQSASDTVESVGVMQYDIMWPKGEGTEDPEALADAIKAAFRPVTGLGPNSYVWRAERLAGVNDDKWYRVPVRLTWRAHSIGEAGDPGYVVLLSDETGAALYDELDALILEG